MAKTTHTLSTTAERTFWLGRYLERAGNTARIVSVNANLLMDLPVQLPLGWSPLVEILALEDIYEELYGSLNEPKDGSEGAAMERPVVRFLLSDQRHSSSVLSSLNFARENARGLRGLMPKAAYQHINDAFLYAKEALAEPLSRSRRNNALQHIIERMQQIDGYLSQTMLHGEAWNFIRLGNFIERADMTTRIIDLRTINLLGNDSNLEPFADIQWRSMLKSLDAMQGYTVTVQNPINQEDVLVFLLQNPDLPRSLLRCYTAIRNCLRALPKNSVPLEQITTMRRQLQRARVRTLQDERLHRYIDQRQRQIDTLNGHIANTYFN